MLNARWNRAKSHTGTIPSRTTPHPRFKRRIRGVSDIIGTILILAITVTLFSSIFFFVNSLPGPTAQSTSQFTASTSVSSSGNYLFLNVSYTAGPVLSAGALAFYVVSQANPTALSCHNPFALSDGLPAASSWSAGQIWSLPFSPANLCTGLTSLSANNNNLTLTIVNVAKNVVLFSVTLPGTQVPIPPIFTSQGTLPSPVSGAGPFSLWAQIRDPHLLPTSTVIANLASLPGPVTGTGLPAACNANPPTGCTAPLTYQPSTGTWTSTALSSTASAIGSSFPILITAKDSLGLSNTVTLYAQFVNPQGANLQVTLTATPGNPIIHQNTTLTAVVSNQGPGGGVATVVFNSSTGNFCPSLNVCGAPPLSFTLTVPISPFASGITVQAYWNATGPLSIGDGNAVVYVTATLGGSAASDRLPLTIYPKTVLVDGSGIAQGSVSPPDPFTYLATDFNSANVPYSTIVAPPNTTTITYTGTGSTALKNYNIIVWDVGNATSGSASNTCLSTQDAQALSTAVTSGISVWMIGGDAFACPSAANYLADFGITSGSTSPLSSLTSLSLTATGPVPLAGFPAGMEIPSGTYESTLTLTAGATSYLCTAACTNNNNVAVAFHKAGWGPTFSTSFDIATLSTTLTYGGSPVVSSATGAQADLVYNVFNYLAGFTQSTNPAKNVNTGTDWAVSQVTVVPSHVSYQTNTGVFFTLRDNGIFSGPVAATLLVDGLPYPAASPVTLTLSPPPGSLGGSLQGVLTWYPATVGYVSVGVEITPPPNDSNAGNNIMYSSLFNVQVYVSYSVLVVDDTLHALSPTTYPDDTNQTVLPALIAAGFSPNTVNVTYITKPCQQVAAPLSQYNLVVWNSGVVTNATATPCTSTTVGTPLSDKNAQLLSSFLVNGGTHSSLLFLGGGLMTDPVTDLAVKNFSTRYLGTTLTGASTPTGTVGLPNGVVGSTNTQAGNDLIGNGVTIPYAHVGTAANYTCLPTGNGSGSFYYNFTGFAVDYWSGQTYCAGTEVLGGNGWHTAYWAFNLLNTGSTANLDLAVLRAGTFFGRLLPNSDTVVSPPDITFATAIRSWTNFDNMHPQLQQQYLITTNVTNLGAATANNLAITLYDGSHILGSQTLTIGGSSSSISGAVTLGTSEFSVPWTPLYAGNNKITLSITSSTAGQILPGVANQASWNVTVYFFYDDGGAGENIWTHSQLSLLQTTEDPSCVPALSGQSTYAFAGHTNVPGEWPQGDTTGITQGYNPANGASYGYRTVGSNGDCETYWPGGTLFMKGYASTWPNAAYLLDHLGQYCPIGNIPAYPYLKDMSGSNYEIYCPGAWGVDNMGAGDTGNSGDACYLVTASYMCGSLAILDDNQMPNYVAPWAYSSPVHVPSDISSASATFWSRYNLAYAYSGGLVCVVYSGTQTGTYTGTGGGNGIGNTPTCNAGPGGTVPVPSPGYTGTIPSGGCSTVSVFTGSSAGGTEGWQEETVNLTQYAGKWVELAFNWLEGNTNGCGGTPPAFSGAGWWINGLNFYASNTGTVTTATDTVTEGTTSGYCTAPTSPPTTYYPQFVPNDLWHRLRTVPSPYNVLPSGSQGAWVSAVPNSGGTLQLDPNMWDSLNTRTIDLTQASQANLNFEYVASVDNANYNPAMGLVLLASPVSSSGQFNWIQLWASGTSHTGWNPSGTISLSGYLGEVIELAFVAGTNCQQVAYPYAGAFMVSDVQITGSTIVPAVRPSTKGALLGFGDMPAFPAMTVAAPSAAGLPSPIKLSLAQVTDHAISSGSDRGTLGTSMNPPAMASWRKVVKVYGPTPFGPLLPTPS